MVNILIFSANQIADKNLVVASVNSYVHITCNMLLVMSCFFLQLIVPLGCEERY